MTEIDWWQGVDLANGVRIVGVPAQHFSGRGLFDRNETLWMGFVVSGPSGNVYDAGDTGFGSHFAEITRRLGPLRFAAIPIGAFRPEWFMGPVHISPADAVRAHEILGGPATMGMHFGTFALADDGQTEPVEALAAARDSMGVSPDRFRTLEPGEAWDVPPVGVTEAASAR